MSKPIYVILGIEEPPWMSLNQPLATEFSPCTPTAPQCKTTYPSKQLAARSAVGYFSDRMATEVLGRGQISSNCFGMCGAGIHPVAPRSESLKHGRRCSA